MAPENSLPVAECGETADSAGLLGLGKLSSPIVRVWSNLYVYGMPVSEGKGSGEPML